VKRRALLINTKRAIVMAFCFKPVDSFMRSSLLFEVEHLLLENILNFAFNIVPEGPVATAMLQLARI
jgi:hypothetical protein